MARPAPTDKQLKFLRKLLTERAGHPHAEEIRADLNRDRARGELTKFGVSLAIDALLKLEKPAPSEPAGCCDDLVCDHGWCEKHGRVTVVDSGSDQGFAGPVYWARLSCGCQDIDCSADVPQP